MKNFLLTLGAIYGIGMAVYGADWYLKDIKQLETAELKRHNGAQVGRGQLTGLRAKGNRNGICSVG